MEWAWADRLSQAGARRFAIRRRTAADGALFMGGSVFYQGARFTVYLVAAKLLGPTLYGLWNALNLVLANGVNYGHLGVLNAMNREVPFNRGRGELELNQGIVDVSFTTALIAAAVMAGACLLASFVGRFDPVTAFGLRVLALLILVQQLQVFYDLMLRSHDRFRLVASEQGLLSILLLTVVIAFTVVGGFAGFLWGQVLVYLAVLLYLARNAPVRPRIRFDWKQARGLAAIGFPIMAVGFAYSMLTSLDRLMVVAFLGKEQLGYYSLSFMAYGTMLLIPRSVSQMVYPKMAAAYGREGTAHALRDLVYRPLRFLACVMLPVVVLAFVLGPVLIRWALPEYIPGIPAFRITLLGVFFLSFMGGFGNFLNTVNRQRLYLAIQLAALGLNFLLNYWFITTGRGITGVATATLITQVVYVGALGLTTRHVMRRAAI